MYAMHALQVSDPACASRKFLSSIFFCGFNMTSAYSKLIRISARLPPFPRLIEELHDGGSVPA
jgi:hypothetical protein